MASAKKKTGKTRLATTRKSKTTSTSKKGNKVPKQGAIGKLVIVESPAKARTVGRFLGKGYTVKASVGHVRDLLRSRLSVDVENNFTPTYRVPNEKRAVVKEIREAAARASEIYLATDPDREGEAIAWHLLHAAEIQGTPIRRVVFHEITESAVRDSFAHPRDIDEKLVNAQQARRILDRLVGYNLTELLWERVRNRLSAGRVQSVAVRLVVEREKEIQAFVPEEYWTLDARLRKPSAADKPFLARLVKIDTEDADLPNEEAVRPHVSALETSAYQVADIKRGQRQRRPSAPFTTSTLQQEASRVLNFTSAKTMSIAQQLYEGIELEDGVVGLITYMRTDSTQVSSQAQQEARDFILAQYGADYLPEKAPQYKTKARGAQEAHEAIRPTSVQRTPDSVKQYLSRDQLRLYTLIWRRFVASQMESAVYNTLRVDIQALPPSGQPRYAFRASGSTLKFKGFLAVYEEARDEDLPSDEDDEGRIFPEMEVGDALDLLALLPEQHFTQPPPRYTEATLVKALEERGIGRPSTYAPTVAVIQDRDYVMRRDKRLYPTETGILVNDLLAQYFPDVLSFDFTATMEDKLDAIAEGNLEWVPVLHEFYQGFSDHLQNAHANMPRLLREELIGRACPACQGGDLVVRYGRWGKFIGCNRYPDCAYTEQWREYVGVTCPACQEGEIIELRSKNGRIFYGCTNYNREDPEAGCQFTSWKRPLKPPCPVCGGLLVMKSKTRAECIQCGMEQALESAGEEAHSEAV
jgi:DNA topoisomerase-1